MPSGVEVAVLTSGVVVACSASTRFGSTTNTVRVLVAALPESSLAVYVTVYTPVVEVSI